MLIVAGLLVLDFPRTASAHLSRGIVRQAAVPAFIIPANGAIYPTTGPYIFKVKPIGGAVGYLWSFVQGSGIVYQDLAWDGHLSPSGFTVLPRSKAHQLIHAGYLRVRVRALLADGQWSAIGDVSVRIQVGALHQPLASAGIAACGLSAPA